MPSISDKNGELLPDAEAEIGKIPKHPIQGYLMVAAFSSQTSLQPTGLFVIPSGSNKEIATKILEEAKKTGQEKSFFRFAPANQPFMEKTEFVNWQTYPDAPYKTPRKLVLRIHVKEEFSNPREVSESLTRIETKLKGLLTLVT